MSDAVFRYEGYRTDPARNLLSCHYSLGGRRFTERVTFPAGGRWDSPATAAAARLVFLLAGVSYYKTAAPEVIDLGSTPVSDAERRFLRTFYADGLGEFGYRNGLDLSGLRIEGTAGAPAPGRPGPPGPRRRAAVRWCRLAGVLIRSSPSRWCAGMPSPRCSSWAAPATGSRRSRLRRR